MAADIFAKSIHVLAKRTEARKNINVFGNMDELQDTIQRSRPLLKNRAHGVRMLTTVSFKHDVYPGWGRSHGSGAITYQSSSR